MLTNFLCGVSPNTSFIKFKTLTVSLKKKKHILYETSKGYESFAGRIHNGSCQLLKHTNTNFPAFISFYLFFYQLKLNTGESNLVFLVQSTPLQDMVQDMVSNR